MRHAFCANRRLRSRKRRRPGTDGGVDSKPTDQIGPITSARSRRPDHIRRCNISFLISPIACAGFKPFGQVRAQFMMVWQR